MKTVITGRCTCIQILQVRVNVDRYDRLGTYRYQRWKDIKTDIKIKEIRYIQILQVEVHADI